jgi:hypothetical protein
MPKNSERQNEKKEDAALVEAFIRRLRLMTVREASRELQQMVSESAEIGATHFLWWAQGPDGATSVALHPSAAKYCRNLKLADVVGDVR